MTHPRQSPVRSFYLVTRRRHRNPQHLVQRGTRLGVAVRGQSGFPRPSGGVSGYYCLRLAEADNGR